MTISRGQMQRQLRRGGGIMDIADEIMLDRDQYILGGIVKSAKKAVKKAAGGIKDFIGSDVGKAALLAAGTYYAGGGNLFGLQRTGMDKFAFSQLPGAGLFSSAKQSLASSLPESLLSDDMADKIGGGVLKGAAILGGSALLTDLFGSPEKAQEMYSRDPNKVKFYLKRYYKNLNTEADDKEAEQFAEEQTSGLASANYGSLAEGGMPTGEPRRNKAGIMELDYRKEGGFVPIGIKEKADDVPAMLSKNEFVFTADAVRGAGDGDIDKGAQRLYNTMKTLENGGTV